MRYILTALIVCITLAAWRGASSSPLSGMLHPAYRDWIARPGEMYGFWLWTGPASIRDQVDRTGANATSMHLMMRLEEDPDAPGGVRVVPQPIDDASLDKLSGVGVGLGEHNNPFFVRYPEWFWELRQEARMKDRDGKTIRVGANPVPAMLDPLLVRLAKEQMSAMVPLIGRESWARYWVIGAEQAWPDYFGLPAGDHSPAMRRYFTAWKRLGMDASVAERSGAAEASGGGHKDDWRDFRDSVVVDRYAGYTAHLHALDPTRPAMLPTHGNPFTVDFRGKLGYPLGDLAGVVDGFEAGPISIDDDAERIIRMTLDQQTSFGVPVVAPRLANKQLDPAAKGGGRTFTPASLRRTVYEALGLGVWHVGLVHWIGDLHDGEWGIAGKPAEAEAKRVFEELRQAGPYLDGSSRLRPRVGVFISDASWARRWQDRWTLLYDEAIKRGWAVALLTDVQIDARLASETPVLLSVDNPIVSEETRGRLDAYMRAGGTVVSVGSTLPGAVSVPDDAQGPAVRVIHQTQTSGGANTWEVGVKPLPMDAIEEAVARHANPRPVVVTENGRRAEGIEPLLLTDGTNLQAVLINRRNDRRAVRLSSDGLKQVRDILTGELLSGDVTIEPLGTALVALEPRIAPEAATSEVAKAESAVARWTKLGGDVKGPVSLLDRAREHLRADRPSKAYALARSITQGLGLRVRADGSRGLKVEVRAWDAGGTPAEGARIRFRLIPGRFEWLALEESSDGVYRLDIPRSELPVFYDPSTEKYDLAEGGTSIIVDAVSAERHGGARAMVTLE